MRLGCTTGSLLMTLPSGPLAVRRATGAEHRCLTEWARTWGLQINGSKTLFWSTHAPTARSVRKHLELPDTVRE
eukprot:6244628-Amphidinium_carterae.1